MDVTMLPDEPLDTEEMPASPVDGAPILLSDPGRIQQRVDELTLPLETHFDNLKTLRDYANQRKQDWFPGAQTGAVSIVRPIIRSAEDTAIAMLTGNEPKFRVASNAADAGSFSPASGDKDNKFERIARAIYYALDNETEVSLLFTVMQRAIEQGEIIAQYGWLSEEERGAYTLPLPETGQFPPTPSQVERPLLGPDPLPAMEGLSVEPARPSYGEGGECFPFFVKLLDRRKVVYELHPLTHKPTEVYHRYRVTVSKALAEYPGWQCGNRSPADQVEIVAAWVGGWCAVMIDGVVIDGPKQHYYGDYPPFVIERCRPRDVADDPGDDVEVLAGLPFAYDMAPSFENACVMSSLKRTIIERTAHGAYKLKNVSPQRRQERQGADGKGGDYQLGPGTLFQLYKDEDLDLVEPAPLPPVLQAALEEAEKDAATLGFSPAILRGEMPGDPSGFSIEQVKQLSNARLQPYKVAGNRALSRLFRCAFHVLKDNWASEWGEAVALPGQKAGGEHFVETITPADLETPPEHVEVEVIPLTPQNKIAERTSNLQMWQAGGMDILDVIEEDGQANPQQVFESALLHKTQLEDPNLRQAAVLGILQQRQAQGIRLRPGEQQMVAPPPAMQPTGDTAAVPPPGARVIGGPHGNVPPGAAPPGNVTPFPARPGPPAQPRPADRPSGAPQMPNNPQTPVVRNGVPAPRNPAGRPPGR